MTHFSSLNSILMKIISSSTKEIESMESEFAKSKNALGVIEGADIETVSANDLAGD